MIKKKKILGGSWNMATLSVINGSIKFIISKKNTQFREDLAQFCFLVLLSSGLGVIWKAKYLK